METILSTSDAKFDPEKRIILSPGVKLITKPYVDPEMLSLCQSIGISTKDPIKAVSEFKYRVTYLAFKNIKEDQDSYLNRMINEFNHYSVFGDMTVTFLLVGISTEVVLELCAHREATICRLTTSATKSQRMPWLSFLPNTDTTTIDYAVKIRDEIEAYEVKGQEMHNSLYSGLKASIITFGMSLKDLHKLFIGRIPPHGNEIALRVIMKKMCNILHEEYPWIIRSVSYYEGSNNGEKLNI